MNKSTQSMDEYCRNLLRLGSLERLRHTAAASFAAATTNMDYWRLIVAGEEVSMQQPLHLWTVVTTLPADYCLALKDVYPLEETEDHVIH